MINKQSLIVTLIVSLCGLYYYFYGMIIKGESNEIHFSLADLNILKVINFQNENIEQIQHLDQLNICVIKTQTKLLIWDINVNQVILQRQFTTNIHQSNEKNMIKYNFIIDDQQYNQNKNILLIIHSSSENETQFYRFQARVFDINSEKQLRINSNVEVIESKLTGIDAKIQAIQEIKSSEPPQVLPSFILIKLIDGSFRKIIYRNNIVQSQSINIKTNISVNKVFQFSKDEYILQDIENKQIQIVSEIDQELNINSNFLEDSIIYENGLIKDRNIKYIVSGNKNDNSVSIIFFFKIENNKYIHQVIQYEQFSYYPSYHLQQMLFLQQKSTNKIYQLKFSCLSDQCSEIDRQLIELPLEKAYIVQKKENDKHAIFLSSNSSNIIAHYTKCQEQSDLFNVSDFTCIPQEQCSHQQQQICYKVNNKRILLRDTGSDIQDSFNQTIQIIEIIFGVIGGIIILTIFFCCIKRYRAHYKRKLLQQQHLLRMKNEQLQKEQAQQIQNQTQYLSAPQVHSSLDNSNSNIQPPLLQNEATNLSGFVEVNPSPSSLSKMKMNGYISQNNSNYPQQNVPNNLNMQRIPSQNSNPQVGNGAIAMHGNLGGVHSYQAPVLMQGQNMMNMAAIQNNQQMQNNIPIQNKLYMQNNLQQLNNLPIQNNLHMQNNLPKQNNLQQQNNLQIQNNFPIQNNIPQYKSDPISYTNQQQQVIKQQMYQQQQFLSQQQNILYKQQQQSNPSHYNQINAIQSNRDNKNHNINYEAKNPISNYNGKQYDLGTPTPVEDLKFRSGKSQPPILAPQPASIEDSQHQGQQNYQGQNNGYYYNQQYKNQQQNNIQLQNQGLKETDIQKKNFEQQMMMLMESGAAPNQNGGGKMNEHFIQPPIVEEGQEENEYIKNQKNSKMNQSIQNNQIGNTQVLKQKFEDELLRQLQGTEIFNKNKNQQKSQSQPPIQQEFPKFIPDYQEEEQYTQKNDDNNQEDDIDERVESQNIVKIIPRKVKSNIQHQNEIENLNNSKKLPSKLQQDSSHAEQINNGSNIKNQINLQASNPNLLLEFMKDELGDSGVIKNNGKFIQSVIQQPGVIPPLYSEFNNMKIDEFPSNYSHLNKLQNQQEQTIQMNEDEEIEQQTKNYKYKNIRDKVLELNDYQYTDQGTIN